MEWETINEQMAHINLNEEQERRNYDRWDEYVKPLLEADNKTIIDYGCGGAYFFKWLDKNYTIKKYIGYDISERSIEEAKKIVRTVKKTPKKLEKADILCCFSVVQHMTREQYNTFRSQIDNSNINKLFIQIRYNHKEEFKDSLTYRCSLAFIPLNNYRMISRSKTLDNGYQYQVYERMNEE